jgi:single-strand selective monofunctional uracil DNA glycosylase
MNRAEKIRSLKKVTAALAEQLEQLRFAPSVYHVYNPLLYAHRAYENYLDRYAALGEQVILVGMNPGPFGMMQVGVPFGDISMVRDWLGIEEAIDKPSSEHPKRRIEGFASRRGEVSGRRLWGWGRQRFGTPEAFFARFFVLNYCPLAFLLESGKNLTPDQLPVKIRNAVMQLCDQALAQQIEILGSRHVIGIGKFAENRIRKIFENSALHVGGVLHPSPASPKANKGWEAEFERGLKALHVEF